jgi:hypothetical protein
LPGCRNELDNFNPTFVSSAKRRRDNSTNDWNDFGDTSNARKKIG